ncbi:MAG TPA: L-aspartate oxidase [candidate division Zixibacteria bacterium]|nr:L-aspartate oxidase [candidate division Zixibacteria bacterium]
MFGDSKHIDTDFLVLGSGVAGLSFALKASRLGKVVVATKGGISEGATSLAQGGVAAVQSPEDSIDAHIEDTLRAGRDLVHVDVVRRVVEFGAQAASELIELGVPLDRRGETLELGLEGGHSHKRILHVADATGKAIEEAFIEAAKNRNITFITNHCAIDLLTQHHLPASHPMQNQPTQCWGAYILDENLGIVRTVRAKATLLATGGGGRLYQHTTNPPVSTADGVAMAFRAGATVANLEFFQFHPTMFYNPGGDSFLISEAVRGEGGMLRNRNGERFMEGVDERMELAPRDVVARAIDTHLKRTGDVCVFLDLTHKDGNFIEERFPNIFRHCLENGIDIRKEWIPVVPGAHYMCGGVKVDSSARTGIVNLLAAGEVAFSGMHGANRLASNSLLESLAYAHFASETARESIRLEQNIPELPDWDDSGVFDRHEWVIIRHLREEITRLMWDYVGIVRSDDRLEAARRLLHYFMREVDLFYRANPVRRDLVELRNLALTATLVVKSALMRKESRGLHFNIDHPDSEAKFLLDTELRNEEVETDTHLLGSQ